MAFVSTLLLLILAPADSTSCDTYEELSTQLRQGSFAEVAAESARCLDSSTQIPSSQRAQFLDLWVEASWRLGEAQADATLNRAKEAVEVNRLAFSPDDPAIAHSMDNLGVVLLLRGEYVAAEEVLSDGLAVASQSAGPEKASPLMARLSGHLAPVLQEQGRYDDALEYYRRTIDMLSVAGESRRRMAMNQNNLATLQRRMGRFTSAQRNYEQALTALREELGNVHPLIGIGVSNLGELHQQMGHEARAAELYAEAISIKESALGVDHPSLATTLNNFGDLLEQQGQFDAAAALLDRAWNIQRDALGPEHPALSLTLMNQADILAGRGSDDEARGLYLQALRIREHSAGRDHPLTAEVLLKLANHETTSGRPDSGLEYGVKADRIMRHHTRLMLRALPESAGLQFVAGNPGARNVLLTIAVRSLSDASILRIWNNLQQSRNLVLDELMTRNRLINRSIDPKTRDLVEVYQRRSARLAHLTLTGPGNDSGSAYQSQVEKAASLQEQAQENLAAVSESLGNSLRVQRTDLQSLLASLPANAAVIDYFRFVDVQSQTARYVAFIAGVDRQKSTLVKLGEARPLERAVRQWRQSISAPLDSPGAPAASHESRYRKSAQVLRELIWDPIAPHVRGSEIVFILPDGALYGVNFDALVTDNGSFLAESPAMFHYLASLQDLAGAPDAPGSAKNRSLLVISSPSFNQPATDLRAQGSRALSCEDFRALRFPPLPWTGPEGAAVTSLWRARYSRDSVVWLSENKARESALRELGPGRHAIHVATHGFFLAEGCYEMDERVNPLLRSGLVLAGANERDQHSIETDDGLLTALELSALNFSGVEWAVLSGCDTGIGPLHDAEGVLGLRRALQVAGARTVIMSLWSVPDEATQHWMKYLYEARLERGQTTIAAVRHANLEALAMRRDENASDHPFYWAGFVASGDWH